MDNQRLTQVYCEGSMRIPGLREDLRYVHLSWPLLSLSFSSPPYEGRAAKALLEKTIRTRMRISDATHTSAEYELNIRNVSCQPL